MKGSRDDYLPVEMAGGPHSLVWRTLYVVERNDGGKMRTSEEVRKKQKELYNRLFKINDQIMILQLQESNIRNTLQNIENKLYKNESAA